MLAAVIGPYEPATVIGSTTKVDFLSRIRNTEIQNQIHRDSKLRRDSRLPCWFWRNMQSKVMCWMIGNILALTVLGLSGTSYVCNPTDIDAVGQFYHVMETGNYTAAAISLLVDDSVVWIVPGNQALQPYAGNWSGKSLHIPIHPSFSFRNSIFFC